MKIFKTIQIFKTIRIFKTTKKTILKKSRENFKTIRMKISYAKVRIPPRPILLTLPSYDLASFSIILRRRVGPVKDDCIRLL